jgi:CRP-like cAMP-binding protein
MVEKFRHYIDLTEEEEKLILTLEENKEHYKYGEKIRRKGDKAECLYIIKEGWAFTSATIDHDVRSIFNIELEGDIVGVSELSFNKNLFDITALTDTVVCPFPKTHLNDLFSKSDRLSRLFYTILSREQSMLYERIISLGRRTALEKVAHLILEISVRLSVRNISIKDRFHFPIRQEHIADLLGLSSIHVNRSMNELKRHGYIEYDRTSLKILDRERLFNLANFNPLFLQKPDISWHHFDQKKAA